MDEVKIRFSDGTELTNVDIGYAEGNLWVYTALGIREAAAIFLDAEKTATMTYSQGDYAQTYRGFTDPRNLDAIPGGTRIMLRGTDTEITIGTEVEE